MINFPTGTFTNAFQVIASEADLKGFKLLDQSGKFWDFKTDQGGSTMKLEIVYGPIVGFRIITTPQISYNNGADVYYNVPVYFQVIYNKCAC